MTIKLLNIYTRKYGASSVEKSCTVYNNGIMRLEVWAEVQYQDESESDVISDVQKNLTIYLDQAGDMSAWTRMGGEAGPYDHDLTSIDRGVIYSSENNNKAYNTTRVPVYFTVPQIRAKTISVLAAYKDNTVSSTEGITVNIIDFYPNGFSLRIDDVNNSHGECTLRKLYIEYPSSHYMTHWQPKGLGFGHQNFHTSGYDDLYGYLPVTSMNHSSNGHKAGAFVMKNDKLDEDSIAPVADSPWREFVVVSKKATSNTLNNSNTRYTSGGKAIKYGNANCDVSTLYNNDKNGWKDSVGLDVNKIKNIFLEGGIPMIKVAQKGLKMTFYRGSGVYPPYDYQENEHIIIDNFGNKMKITINWDKGDWWGVWAVTNVEKA